MNRTTETEQGAIGTAERGWRPLGIGQEETRTSRLPWRRRTSEVATPRAVKARSDVLAACDLAWAHLRLVWHDEPAPFVFTSVRPHALVPLMAYGIALAARGSADASTRVLLIDGDLRRGSLTAFTNGYPGERGLSDALRGDLTIEQVSREVAPRLNVMQAGPAVGSSAEALASGRMKALLAEARTKFTYTIISTPPMSAGPDAAILIAASGNLVLSVADLDANEAAAVRAAVDACGATLRGLVYLDRSASKLHT
ncbi:MAG: P-loop NTPase family protein [Dehalococcoidia bacterium]